MRGIWVAVGLSAVCWALLAATWTKAAQALVLLTTTTVLSPYAEVTGFDPQTGANDNGTILLDQLNHWRIAGLPGRDYLTAFGSIAPTDV